MREPALGSSRTVESTGTLIGTPQSQHGDNARRRPRERRPPTEAIGTALNGLARGDELGDVAARLAPLHPPHNTFPGEVLLDLAADAIGVTGASRQAPLEFEGIRERYLPETVAHTKAQHHKSKFALRAAAMLNGGVDPGLLDEVQWWRTDDLWYWSLEALAAYVRAAADRSGQSVESVCRRLASERDITVAGDEAP
jgi:hypothetical protein